MNSRSTLSDRLKAFLVIESVLLLIALVIPVTPDKTGKPLELPPDLQTYLLEVALAFALGQVIVIVLAGIVWVSVGMKKGRSRDA